jgi:uncharacterized protein YjlB
MEQVKKQFEAITGYGRPGRRDVKRLVRVRKPHLYRFADDGRTPNNPRWPMIVYRGAVALPDDFDPAAVFETLFQSNRWGESWRDGMYPFNHFHTQTHETLGIARGWVRAQLGGANGRELTLKTGDVVIFPAGTGHRRRAQSRDLLIVGAYPPSSEYDEPKPQDVDHDDALAQIAKVKRPSTDPVYGRDGPLTQVWET